MNPPHRNGEVPHHLIERAVERRAAPDQHVIVAGLQRVRRGQPHHLTQAPPYPVTLHRIAHLPRHRKTDARNATLGAAPRLHQERVGGRPHRGGGCPKIHPALQPLHGQSGFGPFAFGKMMRAQSSLSPAASSRHALRRLRPWARRAATTLRPPLVAIRARKP
jgi:hypothetical protein